MLVIRDTSIVPPEDWTYYIEATNTKISTKNYTQIYPMIVQHCKSNNVSVPDQQTVINYMCANLHIPCYEAENGAPLINAWSLGLPTPARTGCCGR